jgi:hypothetical protein
MPDSFRDVPTSASISLARTRTRLSVKLDFDVSAKDIDVVNIGPFEGFRKGTRRSSCTTSVFTS